MTNSDNLAPVLNWYEQDILEFGDSSLFLEFNNDGSIDTIIEAYGSDVMELEA